jgi:hypothetical protein
MKKITNLSENWNAIQTEGLSDRINQTIQSSIIYAEKLRAELTQTVEETVSQRREELQEYQRETLKLETEFAKIKDFISKQESSIKSIAKDKASKCVKLTRTHMNQVIEGNVFDGDALSLAFKETQKEFASQALDDIFYEIQDVKTQIDLKLDALSEIHFEKCSYKSTSNIEREETLKYEKGLDALLKLGGAATGTWVGAIAAGKAGAIAGAYLGGVAPGVGNAVGAVAGFVVCTAVFYVGSCIGSLSKQKIRASRALEAKRALEPYYKEIEKSIIKTVSQEFSRYSEHAKNILDEIIVERHEIEYVKESDVQNVPSSDDLPKIEHDINDLRKYTIE